MTSKTSVFFKLLGAASNLQTLEHVVCVEQLHEGIHINILNSSKNGRLGGHWFDQILPLLQHFHRLQVVAAWTSVFKRGGSC